MSRDVVWGYHPTARHKEAAESALKRGRVVKCRFFFYHIVVLSYYCTSLLQYVTKRIRRRGKKLVPKPFIANTNDHNEFCKVIVERETPFRSASTDLGQSFGRCNIDLQLMTRTIDPDGFFQDDADQRHIGTVDPSKALAMYGIRAQMPDAPLLRNAFHSIAAMAQAAHNCDFYITKYVGKSVMKTSQ